jgi:integration host factor subunit beta
MGMTKADLVDQVAETVQLPKSTIDTVLTQCLQSIMAALQAGETVALRGFGRFRLRQRSARAGRNPRTGDTVPIPAKAVPTFLAGTACHKLVQTAAAPSEGANGRTRVS